ncbi:hypothetical protein K432DRAFT_463277, partial [Lepidopterella palustris CBS 459.81]
QKPTSTDQSTKCSVFLNNAIIKKIYKECIPSWIKNIPDIESDWTLQMQILEGYSDPVHAAAFSPDGKLVVSGSNDKTVGSGTLRRASCSGTSDTVSTPSPSRWTVGI